MRLAVRAKLNRGRRLRQVGKRAKRESHELIAFRLAVLKRAGWQCERCWRVQGLHAHHILPRSRGGTHDPDNGACLCWRCHFDVHERREPWRPWIR